MFGVDPAPAEPAVLQVQQQQRKKTKKCAKGGALFEGMCGSSIEKRKRMRMQKGDESFWWPRCHSG